MHTQIADAMSTLGTNRVLGGSCFARLTDNPSTARNRVAREAVSDSLSHKSHWTV
jgi:hypothetical protein